MIAFKRRAQLMAHRGQEVGLGAARQLGPLLGGAQLVLSLLEPGQVEIGQHPPAVGQRHALVLDDPTIGELPFARRNRAGPQLGEAGLDIVRPVGVRDTVDATLA